MPRLLVIDDDYDVRTTIAMVLRIKGFEVVGANSGVAALMEFERSKFDVAIVDFFLQGMMNGHEIIRSLREKVPTLPIVAISGVAALDFLAQYPDLSNVVCLPKPFRPNELMDAIDAATRCQRT